MSGEVFQIKANIILYKLRFAVPPTQTSYMFSLMNESFVSS